MAVRGRGKGVTRGRRSRAGYAAWGRSARAPRANGTSVARRREVQRRGRPLHKQLEEDTHVLRWALAFLIIAVIAAVFGFSGLAHDAAWVGQLLAFVFVVLFLISLIFG